MGEFISGADECSPGEGYQVATAPGSWGGRSVISRLGSAKRVMALGGWNEDGGAADDGVMGGGGDRAWEGGLQDQAPAHFPGWLGKAGDWGGTAGRMGEMPGSCGSRGGREGDPAEAPDEFAGTKGGAEGRSGGKGATGRAGSLLVLGMTGSLRSHSCARSYISP